MIDQLILSNKPSNYLVTSTDLNNRYLLVTQKICSEMNITKDQLENNPDVKYVYKELKRSSFKRSFKVDDSTLNVNKISAKFDNGILNVTIPKKEVIETKAKKVKIL